eukprot:1021782-Rhodomonas_salina.4
MRQETEICGIGVTADRNVFFLSACAHLTVCRMFSFWCFEVGGEMRAGCALAKSIAFLVHSVMGCGSMQLIPGPTCRCAC